MEEVRNQVALLRANGFSVAPEQTMAFLAAIELLGPRSVTEFVYRINDAKAAHVFVGVQIANRDEPGKISKIFEKHGFKTAAAENGEEGIRKAKAMKPDLIFMDIVMPGVNGYQATRMLINDPETSLIPIIMVTTKGQETDRVWGLRQGAVDYLVKPVSAQALVEKAQAALAT